MLAGKTAIVTASTSGIGLGIPHAPAAFVCTNAASSITGTLQPIDGGWTAH